MKKRYWYDTEFLERGPAHPIVPISIGVHCEDGRSLYLINGEAPLETIYDHPWLRENVLKWLPVTIYTDTARPAELGEGPLLEWNEDSYVYTKSVLSLAGIRAALEEFFIHDRDNQIELWADFCSYDHVVLAQLWGTMTDLPSWMPQRTHDVQQLIDDWGLRDEWDGMRGALETFVGPGEQAHVAIADAGWCREVWAWANRMKAELDGSAAK
jgi:hypothetical protein